MANVGVQLFTYDEGWNAVNLLQFLEAIFEDAHKLRVVWVEHDGTRRTSTLSRIISAEENGIKLNDCYVQSPIKRIRPGLKAIEIFDVIVHLNISPDCRVWARSAEQMLNGKTPARKVISGALSLERSAKYRKPQMMASALEITFKSNSKIVENLIRAVCDSVSSFWPRLECSDKFGTVDVGGEWLFFPRTGYNPNVSNLFAYYSVEARTAWAKWRGTHNVSFELPENGEIHAPPQMIVHSVAERQPSGASATG